MTKQLQRHITAARFEVRDGDDGTVGFRGYAAVFDQIAHGEVVRSSAFTRTLADADDVRFLVNHDGVPVGRTKSGTMTLSVDETGLVVDVSELDPANPTVAELISAMRRGDIDQMSFAFWPVRTIPPAESADGVRELVEVKLADVSVVTYPWYDQTTAELNGLDHALVALRSACTDGPAAKLELHRALRPVAERELNGWTLNDLYPLLYEALDVHLGAGPGEPYYYSYWIIDVSDEWFVFEDFRPNSEDPGTFQIDFTVTADGAVTLGTPRPVIAKTTYIERSVTTSSARARSLDLLRAAQ